MPTAPLLPGSAAAQATVSAPSRFSASHSRNVPPEVPRPRTSWITTM